MRRVLVVATGVVSVMVLSAGPALACGGLIGPNGAVNLTRTTTFAGYANGIEHYVTAFNFAGGTGKFGSITPLPGVPTKVERGGDWTLQRLVRETTPVRRFDSAGSQPAAAPTAAKEAEVLLEAKVDALDITILKGSAAEVGRWAKKHGFRLPPDAPEVLDFYARRSPIFMAAAFDADRAKARGQAIGDGTPLHLTIPTKAPWVPLRILGLGKQGAERVDADVYLLTERRPTMLPAPTRDFGGSVRNNATGLFLEYDQQASPQLLRDLRDDKSGSWVPRKNMWLSKVRVQTRASELKYDLAVDQSGLRKASFVAAGLVDPEVKADSAVGPESIRSEQQFVGSTSRLGGTNKGGGGIAVSILLLGLGLACGVAVVLAARRTP